MKFRLLAAGLLAGASLASAQGPPASGPGPVVSLVKMPYRGERNLPDLSDSPDYLEAGGLARLLEGKGAKLRPVLTARLEGEDQKAYGEWNRLALANGNLARLVAAERRAGGFPVGLLANCSALMGMLGGLQHSGPGARPLRVGLVFIDAHGDFNTPETTPSGFIGGMPLAMLVGRGDQTLVEAAGMQRLPEASVYLSDARDLDPGEDEAVRRPAIHHVADLSELPQRLPAAGPLYVHLDCDVLDPEDAPAMSYPAPGGPSLEKAVTVLAELAATGRIVAVSVTVWNFGKDGDGRTERACGLSATAAWRPACSASFLRAAETALRRCRLRQATRILASSSQAAGACAMR